MNIIFLLLFLFAIMAACDTGTGSSSSRSTRTAAPSTSISDPPESSEVVITHESEVTDPDESGSLSASGDNPDEEVIDSASVSEAADGESAETVIYDAVLPEGLIGSWYRKPGLFISGAIADRLEIFSSKEFEISFKATKSGSYLQDYRGTFNTIGDRYVMEITHRYSWNGSALAWLPVTNEAISGRGTWSISGGKLIYIDEENSGFVNTFKDRE